MKMNLTTGVAVGAALCVIALFFVFSNPLEIVESTPFSNMETQGDLVVQDEVVGAGDEAAVGRTVRVHYTGKLENGIVFDTSLGKDPIEFMLGAGMVISGWEQGLVGMKEGGKRLLIIPPNLGYGPDDYGPIPGGSTLIFEVELVEVK